MTRTAGLGLASFAFLIGFGGVLWHETGSAVFAAMLEVGYLLCN